MLQRRHKTRSPAGTLVLAELVAELLLPAPKLILLRGNLGAGKTTLVKGIAAALGAAAPDDVTSPTFTLIHEYQGKKVRLLHLDLYRLDTEAQLQPLGLDELAAKPDTLLLIEWGEKFPSLVARADGEILIEQGPDAEDDRLFFIHFK